MERYKPDDYIPLDESIERVERQKEAGYISQGPALPALPTQFSGADKEYGAIPLNQEQYQTLQQVLADEEMRSQCLPDLFDDLDRHVKVNKARIVNLYYEHEGDWNQMRRDHRCVGYTTLKVYWADPKFRACIMALDDTFTLESESIIKGLARHSTDERVRLEAATRWLRAKKPEEWNPAVQKQIVANKGSLQQTFFKQLVSQEDFVKTLSNDPFSPLPEEARKLLAGTPTPPPQSDPLLTLTPPEVIAQTMPDDPFGLEEEEDEEQGNYGL